MNKRLQYSLTHNACIKPSIYSFLMKSSHSLATTSSKMLCQQAIRHAKCYISITKAKTHCTHALSSLVMLKSIKIWASLIKFDLKNCFISKSRGEESLNKYVRIRLIVKTALPDGPRQLITLSAVQDYDTNL